MREILPEPMLTCRMGIGQFLACLSRNGPMHLLTERGIRPASPSACTANLCSAAQADGVWALAYEVLGVGH